MGKLLWGFTLLCLLAAGCEKKEAGDLTPSSTPTPTPPPRIGAVVQDFQFGWSDKNGNRVADISAKTGAAAGATMRDAVAELKNGQAILYQKGVKAAILTAERIQPDTARRVVVGTGNVVLRTANPPNGVISTVRADRIVWEYDKNTIKGEGNVLVTHGALARIPGTAFTADTHMQSVNITGGAGPVTGTIP